MYNSYLKVDGYWKVKTSSATYVVHNLKIHPPSYTGMFGFIEQSVEGDLIWTNNDIFSHKFIFFGRSDITSMKRMDKDEVLKITK